MHRMSTAKLPSPQSFVLVDEPGASRIRLTISVTPAVHDAFQRLATASGHSISRTMGDWLGDTMDAALYTAKLIEKARAAPKKVMREVHAYALGLADETGELMAKITKAGAIAAAQAPRAPQGAPPSSNTGGKVPRKGAPGQGKGRA
jgi:hypothetical protein